MNYIIIQPPTFTVRDREKVERFVTYLKTVKNLPNVTRVEVERDVYDVLYKFYFEGIDLDTMRARVQEVEAAL